MGGEGHLGPTAGACGVKQSQPVIGQERGEAGAEGKAAPPCRRAPTGRAAPAPPPCQGPGSVRRAGVNPSLPSHPFGHPHCSDSFGVSVQDPRAGGSVIFSHGHGGFDRVEGDFPPTRHLAGSKVKIERQGAASKRTGSIQAACSRRQIWLRSPQESNSSPAKKAAPVPGGCPRGCSGPAGLGLVPAARPRGRGRRCARASFQPTLRSWSRVSQPSGSLPSCPRANPVYLLVN